MKFRIFLTSQIAATPLFQYTDPTLGLMQVSRSQDPKQIGIQPVTMTNGVETPRDVTSGTFDMKTMYDQLISHGVISGSEYVNGAEFGSKFLPTRLAPGQLQSINCLTTGNQMALQVQARSQHYGGYPHGGPRQQQHQRGLRQGLFCSVVTAPKDGVVMNRHAYYGRRASGWG